MAPMSPVERDEPDARPPQAARAKPGTTRLSPKKLLLSKWTAVAPVGKEKHFVVVRVIEPVLPDLRIDQVELEAVHSRRSFLLPWRALTDPAQWRQGWV